MYKYSVIIPAYNESETIGEVIKKIIKLYPDFEIIVIDDGSEDSTAEQAIKSGAKVYRHPYNIGNGAAVKTGIRHAKGDILIFMDGDGQHDPTDIANIIKYFPEYDMVVGARQKDYQSGMIRKLGNNFYNILASYVAQFKIQDLTSGFRAVKSDLALLFISLLPNTYSYPTTLTLCVLRSGRSIKYTPIKAKPRQKGVSNIKIFQHGIKFFNIILKICTLYSPLRIFFPISLCLFTTGIFYYLYTYINFNRFTNMSALLFSTSVIIFMIGLVSEQISQMWFANFTNNFNNSKPIFSAGH